MNHAYELRSSIIFAGFLAGLVGVHRSRSNAERLEAWGFRLAFLGYLLLAIRFLDAWIEELDFDAGYFVVGLPGLLLTLGGSTLFGIALLRARAHFRCDGGGGPRTARSSPAPRATGVEHGQ